MLSASLQVPFDSIQLAASPLILGNTKTEDLGRSSFLHTVRQLAA